jgi:hypothetical protein
MPTTRRWKLYCEMSVRWFDPARHFGHGDTAVVYGLTPEDCRHEREHVTFLAYAGDGHAHVMTVGGEGLLLHPDSLKPLNVTQPW